MTAVEFRAVSRRQGRDVVLQDLELDVPEGSTFALVGPNGAGKTTALKLIATLLRPSSGSVRVLGHDTVTEAGAVRRLVGYVPDVFGSYPGVKVREYLEFFAGAHRLRQVAATVTELLALVDLRDVEHRYLTMLSRGTKQRLAIARALLHDPPLLLLDEPTFALDLHGRRDVLAVLRELRGLGKTLVVSSHLLEDVAQLATDVAVLDRGRLLAHTGAEELRHVVEGPRRIRLEVANDPRQAQAVLAGRDDVRSIEPLGQEVTFVFTGSRYGLPDIVGALVAHDVKIIRFAEDSNDLEVLLGSLHEREQVSV